MIVQSRLSNLGRLLENDIRGTLPITLATGTGPPPHHSLLFSLVAPLYWRLQKEFLVEQSLLLPIPARHR